MTEVIKQVADIATSVIAVVSVVLLVISIILKKSGNKKLQEKGEELASVQATLSKVSLSAKAILNYVLDYMAQAEENVNFTGADKKKWVVMQVKEACENAGIPLDQEELDENIEKLIEFSKQVNPPQSTMAESEEYKEEKNNG